MADTAYRYLLIEGGALLEKCKAIQAEWMMSLKAATAFAEAHGAKALMTNSGSFVPGPVSVIGLAPVSPLPKGWKLSRRRNFMEPRADAKELREEMNALPKFPDTRSQASDLIGWDPNITERNEAGQAVRSCGLPHAQLIWTGGKFCAVVPMHGFFGEKTTETIAHAMAMPVPEGCREITQAEWEMISATEKVEQQKAREAA